ncbi:MAG TPA: histidine phosphatase family protein [Candidatus Sulfotelmatobacter sp.]|nr:histidine phosphatase family protein [Candidatus Sulfotelmatobacter sp.]
MSVDEVVVAMRALERAFLIGVEGVTEVWLVRHGDVYAQLDEPEDPPLSSLGRAQASRLAARLRQVKIDAVYASPLRRALETARAFHEEPQIDARLIEVQADFTGGRVQVMEAPDQVVARMQASVRDAVAAHPGERIVMVGHGLAILNYLCAVLRLEPGSLRLYPGYTSISVVRMKDGQAMAGSLFDVAHLEGLGSAS